MVVYLDVVFILSFGLGYSMLSITSFIVGVKLNILRQLLGSTLSALSIGVIFLPTMYYLIAKYHKR